jgi:hypothetical protein
VKTSLRANNPSIAANPGASPMNAYPIRIKPFVQAELDASRAAEQRGEFATAFRHLERAHVLGQPVPGQHVRVHWRMFRFALRHRLAGEAAGQSWRLVAAATFTVIGLLPIGNTGGADVSGFRPMPIPDDLRQAIALADGQTANGGRSESHA